MSDHGCLSVGNRRLTRGAPLDQWFARAAEGIVICFGGIGFWTDGATLVCRLTAGYHEQGAPGFAIALGGGR